jgi:hypothetical protein
LTCSGSSIFTVRAGLPAFEDGLEFLEHLEARDVLGVAALGGPLGLADRAVHGLQVGEDQFRVDDLDVADGVDAAGDVE